MEEIKNAETTETTEVATEAVENADNGAAEENEVQFTDTADEAQVEPKKQTPEENSANARRRREAERNAALEKARVEATIEAVGGVNPYTHEKMVDKTDVDEFLRQRKIEKDGGDPVADYAKYAKQEKREAEAKEAKENEAKEWYSKDRENFAERYPDVDISKLIADERFADYADGKVGKKPLADIYASYLKFSGNDDEEKAKRMAAQMIANSKAAVGSKTTAEPQTKTYFTRAEVNKMTQAEVNKNYELIRESMKKW